MITDHSSNLVRAGETGVTGLSESRGLLKRWQPRSETLDSSKPLLHRILSARGLNSNDEATGRFLSPSLSHLHDPSLIPDLDRAANRLLEAARAGEKIVIYGDYDVDGVTATAILFHLLRAVVPGAIVESYIPHRLDEGYGLNAEALKKIAVDGARVIVSVDCGVTAVGPAAALANEYPDVHLIITDHHTPPATLDGLPRAFAVVHPKRPDSAYPFGELCGAGVAFKIAWRIATIACGSQRVSDSIRTLLLNLLSLAALGVIADVVPLRDENRVIARFGLSMLRSGAFRGLTALIAASGLADEKISAEDVGFRLAPRLNACGRMGHAREAVELLTVATGTRARELAEQLTHQNELRRATERRIFEQAVEHAIREGMTRDDRRAIVLAHSEWHQGVVGIVCSRLVERFHRPVLLLQDHGEECHGSGRSIDGFNLHGALDACSEALLSFGGHDMAAGLKLRHESLAKFSEDFIAFCTARLTKDDLTPIIRFDCNAVFEELSIETVRELDRLAPFGRENPRIALLTSGLRVVGHPETFGSLNKHLSVRVAPVGQNGRVIRLIGWNWAERISQVPGGSTIEAIIKPAVSSWGGRKSVECELVDLRVVG